jgi:GT2 family glycosyltransferase
LKPVAFVIITYNRPEDMLELLKNIVQLDKSEELVEEVIVVNNASTADYTAIEKYVQSIKHLKINYILSPENLGVARGRNFAIQKSTAPILIMLDDDAILQNKDCLEQLVQEFKTNNTERPKAIVSFKVLYYETLQMQKNALPHKQFNTYKDKSFFETYFYAGGAHAIRRHVLNEIGSYPEDFFYGMEEYDLSYRILDKGYSIVYSDKIVMLHKESPLGRKPKAEKLMMMWVNKSKVAWRYLPKKYFYTTAILWSFYYLLTSGGHLKGYITGWGKIVQIPKTVQRNKVKKETLSYLKTLHARLWY